MTTPLRLAVVRDYRAENWPSMDLCADQLLAHLPPSVGGTDSAPRFARVFGWLPILRGVGHSADRVLNRHLLLPRVVRKCAKRVDFVHIVDHSYAHLANAVPPGRAGVYCHDLDAFRCLLDPAREPRPWWFRRLARRTLAGLSRAAVVFHNSVALGAELRDRRLVRAERLVLAPLGVAEEFTPDAPTVELPVEVDSPFVLHVGNNIPRKRLDVLLDVFAELRRGGSDLRLIQVGGPWPQQQAEQITRLGIAPFVTQVRGLSRAQLAHLYRRAAVVLVPSDAEGFGLPVIEALACGTPVVASALATLSEAGGDAAAYCPVADIAEWVRVVRQTLVPGRAEMWRARAAAQAARFSWREHARIIAEAYLKLATAAR